MCSSPVALALLDKKTVAVRRNRRLDPTEGGAGQKKNPAPQSARGSEKSLGNPGSSLAVFYVEQVALNRHDSMSKLIDGFVYHNRLIQSTFSLGDRKSVV